MGKVSWTAEEHCQIEFVVVVVFCDFAPECITVLPDRITDTITEQAFYSAVQLAGEPPVLVLQVTGPVFHFFH